MLHRFNTESESGIGEHNGRVGKNQNLASTDRGKSSKVRVNKIMSSFNHVKFIRISYFIANSTTSPTAHENQLSREKRLSIINDEEESNTADDDKNDKKSSNKNISQV